jgi:FtsP/CotA-like multicopper oxidase with cupredoxin domain
MERLDKIRLTRRDMIKLSAGGAGMFALTASGFAVPHGLASGGTTSGKLYIEAFPTSPLITTPFSDELTIPPALRPNDLSDSLGAGDPATAQPNKLRQDSIGPATDTVYQTKYHQTLGQHQCWPGEGATAGYFPITDPIVYQIKLQVGHHDFTSSSVLPINSLGQTVAPPNNIIVGTDGTTKLPHSTIWGFSAGGDAPATFPGPRINAEYHRASVVRFENWLGTSDPAGYDSQDFGSPARSFLTHLHNGHTAPESDGQPHYGYHRFNSIGRITHDAAWKPGEWVDQCYLGYAAGGDEREKQSFFWFHDHVHGHTGADVYKGMVGLMPIYDPKIDRGDEADPNGLRLPGVRVDNHVGDNPNNAKDGTFEVKYDIPLAFYDCRLDDGVTPHKDAHNGNGETHPEWWGMSYFRHFPNHGFVGDIFTVNGTAYPVLHVDRRRYRLRFLDASISRIYEFKLMTGNPKAARDLGYTGDELQGQYRLPDGSQCMKFVEVANEGGLLPNPIERDSFELWPAKRREVVVDFSKYMDGSPTKTGDVVYLVDVMKMTTGRMWDAADPAYKVPMIKIVIGDVVPDNSLDPRTLPVRGKDAQGKTYTLREPQPFIDNYKSLMATAPTFELQRGSSSLDPETEWLINGQQFDPAKPMASPIRTTGNNGYVWRIRNGGGGWVHPFHLHMEEHRVIQRNGKAAPDARHPDDTGKEDVVALDPSEDTYISRRFRTFTGPYVAHCHNLAHEDHNMMFGWEILPQAGT